MITQRVSWTSMENVKVKGFLTNLFVVNVQATKLTKATENDELPQHGATSYIAIQSCLQLDHLKII